MKSDFFEFDPKIISLAREAEARCVSVFKDIDLTAEYNSRKVLAAFSKNRISESHFAASTGYGYGDRGRDALDRVCADIFGAQSALMRHNFVSGTHALTVSLFGILRPGDTMVSVTGTPYDTIHPVIGIGQNGSGKGSLKDYSINYRQIELSENGHLDLEAVRRGVNGAKLVYLQRSRGYSLRPSITVEEIRSLAGLVHEISPSSVVMVDNCYGEFVEELEPTDVGADLMAGSLIKNPGAGIASTGGYIAGRADLVDLCACRLSTPATGAEVGCSLGQTRPMFMGLFLDQFQQDILDLVEIGAVRNVEFAAETLGSRAGVVVDEVQALPLCACRMALPLFLHL